MMNNKTEQVTELARAIGNYNIQDGRKYALLASYLYDEGYRRVPEATRTLHVGSRHICSNCGELACMENYCSRCGAKVIKESQNEK